MSGERIDVLAVNSSEIPNSSLIGPAAAIARQKAEKESLRLFPRAPRKPQPRITQADVTAAVDAALAAVVFELREHKNDLPRWSQAMDFAIATVLKHKERKA